MDDFRVEPLGPGHVDLALSFRAALDATFDRVVAGMRVPPEMLRGPSRLSGCYSAWSAWNLSRREWYPDVTESTGRQEAGSRPLSLPAPPERRALPRPHDGKPVL